MENTEEIINKERNANQIVTFKIGDEQLGFPIDSVQEIIKPPKIYGIPHAPESVKGITHLRGNVLTVVDLRIRLGIDSLEFSDTTRVLIVNLNGISTGLIVDAVSEVVDLSQCEVEKSPENIFGIAGTLLDNVVRKNDSDKIILLLSLEKVLVNVNLGENMEVDIQRNNLDAAHKVGASNDTQQFVAFKVGREECALSILGVKEIIRFNEVTPIHQAANYILGLMYLREKLIPVIDLRVLLGQKSLEDELDEEFMAKSSVLDPDSETYSLDQKRIEREHGEKRKITLYMRRIIVIAINNIHVGVLVDSVSQVMNINASLIEGPPPIITGKKLNGLNGVAKLDNGNRIIILLEMKNLLNNEDFLVLQNSSEELAVVENEKVETKKDEEFQMVCFKVDGEEYSFDIQSVQEIIRQVDITKVPHSKPYMKGIINLRGSVAPVVCMRERFGIKGKDIGEQSRIIIIKQDNHSIGLIVDSVTEVLRLSKSLLEDTDESITLSHDKFIKSIAKMSEGKRLIGLLDSNQILFEGDVEELLNNESEVEEQQAV